MYISPLTLRIIGFALFAGSIIIAFNLMHNDTISKDLRRFLDFLAVAMFVASMFIIS